MRVIIVCEESQVICKAFRDKGHEAYSCDLQDCSGGHPEWHIKEDASKLLNEGWDLMIGHPPCTRLSNSGVWYLLKHQLWDEMMEACSFFLKLWAAPIPKICLENPIQHGYARKYIPKYDQIIQPYNFGEDASKATCLWLKGLNPLVGTEYFPPRIIDGKKRWANQTDGDWNNVPPSSDRGKLRSKTYPGIAKAMAEQWG